MVILCLAPVIIAGLLLYLPGLSEVAKILILGVILLAMGIFGEDAD